MGRPCPAPTMPARRRRKCWSRARNGPVYGPGSRMTTLSRRINFPTGWPADPLDRRIALARASLGLERLLPALWPAIGFTGLYLAAALFGLFRYIPWEAQSLLLAAAVTSTSLALYRG